MKYLRDRKNKYKMNSQNRIINPWYNHINNYIKEITKKNKIVLESEGKKKISDIVVPHQVGNNKIDQKDAGIFKDTLPRIGLNYKGFQVIDNKRTSLRRAEELEGYKENNYVFSKTNSINITRKIWQLEEILNMYFGSYIQIWGQSLEYKKGNNIRLGKPLIKIMNERIDITIYYNLILPYKNSNLIPSFQSSNILFEEFNTFIKDEFNKKLSREELAILFSDKETWLNKLNYFKDVKDFKLTSSLNNLNKYVEDNNINKLSFLSDLLKNYLNKEVKINLVNVAYNYLDSQILSKDISSTIANTYSPTSYNKIGHFLSTPRNLLDRNERVNYLNNNIELNLYHNSTGSNIDFNNPSNFKALQDFDNLNTNYNINFLLSSSLIFKQLRREYPYKIFFNKPRTFELEYDKLRHLEHLRNVNKIFNFNISTCSNFYYNGSSSIQGRNINFSFFSNLCNYMNINTISSIFDKFFILGKNSLRIKLSNQYLTGYKLNINGLLHIRRTQRRSTSFILICGSSRNIKISIENHPLDVLNGNTLSNRDSSSIVNYALNGAYSTNITLSTI